MKTASMCKKVSFLMGRSFFFHLIVVLLFCVALFQEAQGVSGFSKSEQRITATSIAAQLLAEREAERAQNGKTSYLKKKMLQPVAQVSFSNVTFHIQAGVYKKKHQREILAEKARATHIFPQKHKRYRIFPEGKKYKEMGVASWYGSYFHGRITSSGEKYDMYGMTAAHKVLPMNTLLLVRNLDNGKQTIVRINDRGPFIKNRIIDLSYSAARSIGMVRNGTAHVEIALIPQRQKRESDPDGQKRREYHNKPHENLYYDRLYCISDSSSLATKRYGR